MIYSKWVKVPGVLTPGGDPCWNCLACGQDEHIFGIETPEGQHEVCRNCGAINVYPWQLNTSKITVDISGEK